MQLTKNDKRRKIAIAEMTIEHMGGKFLSVNWKKNKRKVHFLTKGGNREIINL